MQRRDVLKAAAWAVPAVTAGRVAGQPPAGPGAEAKATTAGSARPLADEGVVVDQWDVQPGRIISDAPSLVRLPDGALLLAYPRIRDPRPGNLRVFRSEDDGRTWTPTARRVEFGAGRLLLHENVPYFLGVGPDLRGDVRISRSDDGGRSWAPPVTLFEDHKAFYNPATGMVKTDERLVWSFGAPNREGRRNTAGSRIVAVAADLTGDPMDPKRWRISNHLSFPDPKSIAGLTPPGVRYHDHWLEGNVVKVGEKIRVIARCRIAGYRTVHVAAVCDVQDDGRTLHLRFVQFHPLPGAQNQFHIIHDEPSSYYWMTSNLPTSPRDERRILALFYGLDPLCWFQAGIVAMGEDLGHAFNYTTPLVDGDDLLIVSRTSREHYHDNDRVTFHRVSNFRSLAANLAPER